MTALEAALHAMELTAKDHQARGIAYPTESYRELQKFRATVNEEWADHCSRLPPGDHPDKHVKSWAWRESGGNENRGSGGMSITGNVVELRTEFRSNPAF